MDGDERKWLDYAMDSAVRAKEKGITVLLVRHQDSNDEADIAITNAESPEMVTALWPSTRGESE